jgi:CubicO group peptidase (beta-lactamase class C family)
VQSAPVTNQEVALGRRLRDRLEDARNRHGVPGAVAGVMHEGEMTVVASGVASVRTGVEVTPDTLFPLGSLTKVYQAALLTSLGLDLDDPVRRHLPEFHVADAEATEVITLRHLLTHSSGLESDFVADFGRGDDAVALYVQSCKTLGQVHPPGLLTSYCNSGFVIAGRVVEVVTHATWDDALRSRLLDPAGLSDSVTLPEDAILRPVALGHRASEHGTVVNPMWSFPRSFGPAGGTLAASAPDVLAFAQLHLAGGAGVLAGEVVEAMHSTQRPWPSGIQPGLAGVGLGWMLYDWNSRRVLGHNGAGAGAHASLRLVPELSAAVVVLTNATNGGRPLTENVLRATFAEELDIDIPDFPDPYPGSFDNERYIGNYDRLTSRQDVIESDETLIVRSHSDEFDGLLPAYVRERRLTQVAPDVFLAPHWQPPLDIAFRFLDVDGDGVSDYLYEDGWAHHRTSSPKNSR